MVTSKKYTKEILEKAVKENITRSDVLRDLGLVVHGGNNVKNMLLNYHPMGIGVSVKFAGLTQLVECNLAEVDVTSSSLVSRSDNIGVRLIR